jgi:hypothetical protein
VKRSTTSSIEQHAGFALILRDAAELWCFSVLAAQVHAALTRDPHCLATATLVDDHVSRWIEFFAQEGLSLERSIGLWGELYLMTQFGNRDRAVATWAGPDREQFDFVGSQIRIEVKTSLRGSVAWFNLEQIAGKDTGYTVFIRVLPDRVRGKSLDELVREIAMSLTDKTSFEWALMTSGYVPGIRPDLKLSAEELHGLPNRTIPRPTFTDSRIKAIRYAVDIDSLSEHFIPVKPLLSKLDEAGQQ